MRKLTKAQAVQNARLQNISVAAALLTTVTLQVGKGRAIVALVVVHISSRGKYNSTSRWHGRRGRERYLQGRRQW